MYNLALTQMLRTRQESVNTLYIGTRKKKRLEAQID